MIYIIFIKKIIEIIIVDKKYRGEIISPPSPMRKSFHDHCHCHTSLLSYKKKNFKNSFE